MTDSNPNTNGQAPRKSFFGRLSSMWKGASKAVEGEDAATATPPEGPLDATPEAPRLAIVTRYQTDIFGQPDEEAAYQHGHVDGAFDGDEEAFIDYIGHRTALRQIEAKIDVAQEDRREAREKLNEVKQTQLQLAEAEAGLEVQVRRTDEAKTAYETAKDELAEARRTEETTRGEGSLLHAVPYLVAGCFFFLGDLIVSFEVVAQALQLGGTGDGWVVAVERWGFAFGIASLTFLIKPAYERLCEQAYWEKRDKVFRWVILIAAGAALVTLGLLGGLRVEFVNALGADDTSAQIMNEIFNDAPTTAAPSGAEDGVSVLQILAFVFTSLLFAVAGAICFGIATFYWRRYFDVRRPALRRLRGSRRWRLPSLPRDVARLREEYEAEDVKLAELQAHVTVYKARVRELGPLEALERQLETLTQYCETLLQAHEERHREALIASYRCGRTLAVQNRGLAGRVGGDGHLGDPELGGGIGEDDDDLFGDGDDAWDLDDETGSETQSDGAGGHGASTPQDGAAARARRQSTPKQKSVRPFLWVRRNIMQHARDNR